MGLMSPCRSVTERHRTRWSSTRRRYATFWLGAALVAAAAPAPGQGQAPDDRFRQASRLLTAGDYPGGLRLYRELTTEGYESASLYWNWAQAAGARGALGEALWALARARELDPSDAALEREIERLRNTANLDRAEVAPEPLAALARLSRRFHFDWWTVGLLGLSLLFHVAARLLSRVAWAAPATWVSLLFGLLLALVPLLGSLARPTAVVVTPGAPLIDAASPSANTLGALREGEIVPILTRRSPYIRLEDSSGARGWAYEEDVRPVDGALPPLPESSPSGPAQE